MVELVPGISSTVLTSSGWCVTCSVVDPHRFDAGTDPDKNFHFDPDLDRH
jgi:hypothetical protein